MAGSTRWVRPFVWAAAVVTAVLLWAPGPLVVGAQGPVAQISSPQPGATVRDVVVVTGTAMHPQFSFYKVEYSREPGANWVVIGETQPTQVRDGVLVQWDTRAVPDGSYSLRLSVVDVTGNYVEEIVRQIVVANATTVATETPTVTGTPPEALTATAEAQPSATPTPAPPTPTVVIEMPVLTTPTPPAPEATTAPRVTVTTEDTSPDVSSTGSTIVDMVKGLLGEMAEAAGLGDVFKGLGSAAMNGALVAVGAFAVVGVVALVRQLFLLIYHHLMQR